MIPGNRILFVLCGIGIAAGVAIYLEASAFQKTAKITMGTVAKSTLSRCEIKYTSYDSVERTFKGTHSSKGGRYHPKKGGSTNFEDRQRIRSHYKIRLEDPKILLAGRKTIDVYIDRNDPEKYFIDIAFLGDSAR